MSEFKILSVDGVLSDFKAVPFPPGVEKIVSMAVFKDRLMVATESGVYELVEGVWRRMTFVEAAEASDVGYARGTETR